MTGLMYRCYDVSRMQNSDLNSQTRASIYLEKIIRRLVSLRTTLAHIAILLPSLLTVFVKVTAVMLQRISQYISTTGPHSFSFFQSVKLNARSTEAPHCSKDVNAEELLGEENAELSESHSEQNFDSCEICKKPFSRRNILFEHTSVSSRETSYCEMCVKSLSVNRSAMRRYRGCERSFSRNVCSKSFISRCDLENHIRVHTGERPFSCGVCKKRFTQRPHIIRHLRVHSGERPFRAEFVRNGSHNALT
jgi:uncharacterized Zn-finger protein